jgi:hypothetical protein
MTNNRDTYSEFNRDQLISRILKLESENDEKDRCIKQAIEKGEKRLKMYMDQIYPVVLEKDKVINNLMRNEIISKIEGISEEIDNALEYHNYLTADYLLNKKHPAIDESKRIRDITDEYKGLKKECSYYKYMTKYLFELFPNIENILFYDDILEEDNCDLSNYLSDDEYLKLSSWEKSDLALERY